MQESKTGRILVMDFGLARSIESEGMTQTGALLGTIEYMSPEQSMGKTLDQRSDIFAVGLIFYELLTGNTPYKADSAMASLLRRNQERAIPVAQLDASIPEGISDIVSKCLERDLIHRYQHADEILRDLDAFQGNQPLLASIPVGAVPSPKRPVPWMWIGVGSSVAILTLLGGWFLRGGLNSTPASNPSAAAVAAKAPDVSLAILPFHNASTDLSINWLGSSLADMLSTDVGQSASLRTVSSDHLHQVLKDLRIAENADIDSDTVKRVAEFSGADTVVSGRYAKFGDQIRIDATVRDLKRNQSHALTIAAASEREIPVTVDGLADLIRKNLAVSSDVVKELKASSFQPTSKSVESLRDYDQAIALQRNGKSLDAQKLFEQATKEDPSFALAYSKLAQTYSSLGYDDKAEQAARKAVDLSQNLPDAERYLIAAIHAQITRNFPDAIKAYENLVKAAPGNTDVQAALAHLYEESGDLAKATQHYQAVLAASPNDITAILALGRLLVNNGKPQESLDYLNRARTLSIQTGNDEQKALILHATGTAYRVLGKPDEALRNYQESMAINRRLGDKAGVARSLNEAGQVLAGVGKSGEAVKNYQEALKLRREIADKTGISDTLIDWGNVYNEQGKYDQAKQMYEESLQIKRDLGDERSQATCLNNIGNIYFAKGDYQAALTFFQQALQLREKLKLPAEVAEVVHNLGDTTLRMGQFDQALTQYLRALDLYRSVDFKRDEAIESHSTAALFEYQGRYGAALKAEEEALKLFRQLEDHGFWFGDILSGQGNALSLVGRSDEAQKSLEEALGVARAIKSDPLTAQILNFQGDRFFYSGDWKSAKSRYEEALRLASHATDREKILVSKLNLAKATIAAGEPREAIRSLKALASEADALALKYLSLECSIYLGQALIDTKDYSLAKQELQNALDKSDKLGARMLLVRGHFLLAKALRLTADGPGAGGHYQQVTRLLEEIRKEADADNIMGRADLKAIQEESARWAQAPKA
jgi:tetratricopeptide (TPR) repeat protein/TolB-like protein